ncbi:MAG: hypothetical protein K9W43_09235 [Candidatus Thorarchaeota archaeon]|nr:hypothetical protein [Candidatus Thorarchaeota archaeon]
MTDEDNPETTHNPEEIRRSLDAIVAKLEPTPESSGGWGAVMAEHREEWERLKAQIHERQTDLKALVKEKKAGTISSEEFEKRYRSIQDELTALEFQVYNLRLGTDVSL